MLRVWYLYLVVTSNSSGEVIQFEVLNKNKPFVDRGSCITSMKDSNRRIRDTHKTDARLRIWGENTRIEFDCLSTLIGTDHDKFSTGNTHNDEIES